MRNVQETLRWLEEHRTEKTLGYNPNGRCLQITREARDIPAVFGSAKIAQDHVPMKHRIKRIRDIRSGMALFHDDPNDSNKFGHVTTAVGRARGMDWDDLDSVLTITNSVKSGELVVVRAGYFKKYWGDTFQFASTSLNGFDLDFTEPDPPKKTRVERFRKSYPNYDVGLLEAAIRLDGRVDLRDDLERLKAGMGRLKGTKNKRAAKVRAFYVANNSIRLDQLNLAVRENPDNSTLVEIRNSIRTAIKRLPAK